MAIIYSQLFNLLCDKADDVYSERIKKHKNKTWIASLATIPKQGEHNRKIHGCMLYYN